MVAPPRTPDAITKRLSDAIAQVLRMPDVRARLAELLLKPVRNTPDEMRATMRKDAERWAPVAAEIMAMDRPRHHGKPRLEIKADENF
jgi:tripartite-type tricarboxylate transporter receptor subunit TctC